MLSHTIPFDALNNLASNWTKSTAILSSVNLTATTHFAYAKKCLSVNVAHTTVKMVLDFYST